MFTTCAVVPVWATVEELPKIKVISDSISSTVTVSFRIGVMTTL